VERSIRECRRKASRKLELRFLGPILTLALFSVLTELVSSLNTESSIQTQYRSLPVRVSVGREDDEFLFSRIFHNCVMRSDPSSQPLRNPPGRRPPTRAAVLAIRQSGRSFLVLPRLLSQPGRRRLYAHDHTLRLFRKLLSRDPAGLVGIGLSCHPPQVVSFDQSGFQAARHDLLNRLRTKAKLMCLSMSRSRWCSGT
jgi:hypothetical protein